MINKVILVGRLGKDPETRYTGSGTPVVNFSLATDEAWNNREGERQTRTEWHNIVVWSRLAEICGKYLKKGKLVYIEGRIQTREWEDCDGNRRWTTEIVANEMKMLSGPSGTQGAQNGAKSPEPVAVGEGPMEAGITDDDIPF